MRVPTDYRFCIQCTDTASGTVGDFVYHKYDKMRAASPVFDSVDKLFDWMRERGLYTGQLSSYVVFTNDGETCLFDGRMA